MNLVELHPRLDCYDIAKALRNIADDIDQGSYEFDPTIAVVVLGRESERRTIDGPAVGYNWQTHGLGECGYFAAKGLLASAMTKFECGQ